MKSLLQEASSIERAISQAWEAAGQPQEFSVKVLERGERSFFGFSSKPAVISLTYTNALQAQKNSKHGESHHHKERDRAESSTRADKPKSRSEYKSNTSHDRTDRSEKKERSHKDRATHSENRNGLLSFTDQANESSHETKRAKPERHERRDRHDRRSDRNEKAHERSARGLLSFSTDSVDEAKDAQARFEKFSTKTQDQVNSLIESLEQTTSLQAQHHTTHHEHESFDGNDDQNTDFHDSGWEPALINQTRDYLQELLAIFGYGVSFDTEAESKTLNITFSYNFINNAESERLFYASTSFLLLQFLKKAHKRRFRGFRIMLSARS